MLNTPIQLKTPINITMCEGTIQDVTPEDFGKHKIQSIDIRSEPGAESNNIKSLALLPECFDGRINKGGHVVTTARGYIPHSVDMFNHEMVPKNKQAISIVVETIHAIRKQVIYLYGRNSLLTDLQYFFRTLFPTFTVYIAGFTTIVPNTVLNNDKDSIITRWERKKITKTGSEMGLRLTHIYGMELHSNEITLGKYTNQQLFDIAGTYRHDGLAEDFCKIKCKDPGILCEMPTH